MLEVRDRDYLRRVVSFAEAKGLMRELLDRLWYLHTYADVSDRSSLPAEPPKVASWEAFPGPEWLQHASGKRCVTTIGPDSSPASFWVSWSIGMGGGLIYHGNQAGWQMRDGKVIPEGYGVETFSVRLGHSDNPWLVHT